MRGSRKREATHEAFLNCREEQRQRECLEDDVPISQPVGVAAAHPLANLSTCVTPAQTLQLRSRECPFIKVEVPIDGTRVLGAMWKWISLSSVRSDRCPFKRRVLWMQDVATAAVAHACNNKSSDTVANAWQTVSQNPGDVKRLVLSAEQQSELNHTALVAIAEMFDWIATIRLWEPAAPGGNDDKIEITCTWEWRNPNDTKDAHRCFVANLLQRSLRDGTTHFDLLELKPPARTPTYRLHRDGLEVYPKAVQVHDNEVERLQELSGLSNDISERIFNNDAAFSEHNDGRRHQTPFEKLSERDDSGDNIVARIQERICLELRHWFPRHFPRSMVLLQSFPGCLAQRAHTDYTPKALDDTTDLTMPLGCVVALMDGTYFDVWPGAIRCFHHHDDKPPFKPVRLVLNAGDVVVFRGDLVHAGASFEEDNVRIHVYLDVQGIQQDPNETYFMHEKPFIVPRQSIE